MNNISEHQTLINLRNYFAKVLTTAAKERNDRNDFVGNEIGWAVYERDCMFDAVTRERAKLGKGSVPYDEVRRAEYGAVGHIDYVQKYSLYCAFLVLDRNFSVLI